MGMGQMNCHGILMKDWQKKGQEPGPGGQCQCSDWGGGQPRAGKHLFGAHLAQLQIQRKLSLRLKACPLCAEHFRNSQSIESPDNSVKMPPIPPAAG